MLFVKKNKKMLITKKKEHSCDDTTFSNIFDRKWRFEIGL